MNPPEPPSHSWCDGCGYEVAEETWPVGVRTLCLPHARLAVAEVGVDGFDRLDMATAVMYRDILNASLAEVERRLVKLSGGKWEGSQP